MLGPVSSGNPEGIGPFWLTCFSLLGICLAWTSIRLSSRARRIQQNAKRRGYAYVGDQLPRDLPLLNSSFGSVSRIQSAFEGESRGRQFVFFDCVLGSGKGAKRRSAIAVLGPRDSFGVERLDVGLTLESVGSWTFLHRERGLLTPEEIDAIVSSL